MMRRINEFVVLIAVVLLLGVPILSFHSHQENPHPDWLIISLPEGSSLTVERPCSSISFTIRLLNEDQSILPVEIEGRAQTLPLNSELGYPGCPMIYVQALYGGDQLIHIFVAPDAKTTLFLSGGA